jgi:hypothetical protein
VSDQPATPTRPWREIAAEITRELDPRKMATLLIELNRALDEQELNRKKTPPRDPQPGGEA